MFWVASKISLAILERFCRDEMKLFAKPAASETGKAKPEIRIQQEMAAKIRNGTLTLKISQVKRRSWNRAPLNWKFNPDRLRVVHGTRNILKKIWVTRPKKTFLLD